MITSVYYVAVVTCATQTQTAFYQLNYWLSQPIQNYWSQVDDLGMNMCYGEH